MSIIRTPLTTEEAIARIRADYPADGNVMAANYDPNGEEDEWDGLTVDDIDTWTEPDGTVDLDGFAEWGPFELWLDIPDAVDATTALADMLEAGVGDEALTYLQRATILMRDLTALGVIVINPQDASWGECKGHDGGGPHEISTSLCNWCLEYDPE